MILWLLLVSIVDVQSTSIIDTLCRTQRLAVCNVGDAHPMNGYSARELMEETNSGIQLTVNATEIDKPDGDWVHVKWSGVDRPSEHDMIGVYAIEEKEWRTKAPIKSTYATKHPSHMKEGSGSLDIKLLNHRQNVVIIFVRRFFGIPRIGAMTPVIEFKHKNAPLQVHLALTGKPNEMRVQWVSGTQRTGWVKWGTESGKHKWTAYSSSTTYTADDLCGHPAKDSGFIFPGYMHDAVITKLVPKQTYYYVFGNRRAGHSKEYSFVAPPEVGDDKTLKIIGLGDMGQYSIDQLYDPKGYIHSLGTTNNINSEKDVDLIAHIGDISYAQGYVGDWDVFFDQLLPITSKVPYMVAMGNHERLYPGSGDRFGSGTDSGGECGVAYEKRLKMSDHGRDQSWYSFDFGSVHFIILCSELPTVRGSSQYEFLKEDLKSVNRKLTPWIIVGIHRPIYIGITKDSAPRGYWYMSQVLQKEIGYLLQKYKVDMIWSGHHHSYHRSCPVYKEKCQGYNHKTGEAKAPVQLVFGNSGATLYKNLVKRDFIEYQEAIHGYVRIYVNRTQLTVESVRNEDQKVIDKATLYKATLT